MNLKLFLVMGVSWTLEVVSSLLPQVEKLWYASDIFNILQGFFVFLIFVCKTKVLVEFQKKIGRKPTRKQSLNATVTTTLSTSNNKLDVRYTAMKLDKASSSSALKLKKQNKP